MGNSSEIIIYKVIRMNSNSITNLPIPTLPHEAATKLYVDSNSRKILQGYVPPLRLQEVEITLSYDSLQLHLVN